jgi:hypothetical protein
LRNGNTFVGARNGVYVFDAHGKDVLSHPVLNDTIFAAQVFRDGQIAYVTYQGNYCRMDAAGKELKRSRLTPFTTGAGVNGIELLPGDRYVVSVNTLNKVIEYDAEGRSAWECSVPGPVNLTRLAHGNTLVISGGMRVIELDRSGKIVQEMKDLQMRPWRVYRR